MKSATIESRNPHTWKNLCNSFKIILFPGYAISQPRKAAETRGKVVPGLIFFCTVNDLRLGVDQDGGYYYEAYWKKNLFETAVYLS